jgi:hypothetical protein
MKNKYQSPIGGRVVLSEAKNRIETTKPDSNNNYLGNILVSIRPSRGIRGYSTNGNFYK